eukprot:GHRR01004142.1.p2 GENE.GHRR01004142.1~~GHRR01004142.1.p2  ORF type:complete len:150 (+),score=45.14 GHRR01004142.1:263-712(+)
MSQPNQDRRIIVYPDYINSTKTVSQGRRIPVDKACDTPTIPEMLDVCNMALKLPAQPEAKRYPRNWCVEIGKELSYGRIRVLLRKEDGTPVNPEVSNRRELMLKLAEYVKKHPDRHKKPGSKDNAAAASNSTAASSSKQPNKKSGKKKR